MIEYYPPKNTTQYIKKISGNFRRMNNATIDNEKLLLSIRRKIHSVRRVNLIDTCTQAQMDINSKSKWPQKLRKQATPSI